SSPGTGSGPIASPDAPPAATEPGAAPRSSAPDLGEGVLDPPPPPGLRPIHALDEITPPAIDFTGPGHEQDPEPEDGRS
ncbi:MAG TPA: hypothetical protein VN253_11570, partial [Kofleriaceae bacterium]|nr:hypothetical protein [Kofleriaceae bacterium]